MPMDSIIVSLLVLAVFGAFMFVLAWTEHRTTRYLRDKNPS